MTSLDIIDTSENLKDKLARILLDNIHCIALLLQRETREIIATNRYGLEAGAVVGKTCYESWCKHEEPCSWCLAPELWQTGKDQNIEVNDSGTIWDAYWIPITENLYLHYAFDITKKKEKEQKLLQSTEKYLHLYENAPLGYQSLDEKGNILEVNKAWLDFFGYSKEEIIGKWFGELLPLEYREIFKEKFEEFKKICSVDGVEYEIVKKNGEPANIIFYGRVGYDNSGNFKQTHCIFQDITEKKQIENKLKISEEKYRNIFEKSSNAIVLLDLTGKIIDCNFATERMFGYSLDELIGQNYLDLPISSESTISTLKKRFHAITNKDDLEPQEMRIIRKDGSNAIVRSAITYITIGEKEYFQAIIEDITEKKIAEQKIRESEEKYRQLFEENINGIILINLKGQIVNWNSTIEKLFGYKRENYIGKSLIEFPGIDQKFIPIIKERLEKYFLGENLDPIRIKVYKKDETPAWINAQSSLVDVGKEQNLQIIIEDITDLVNAEMILKESEERYRELFESSPVGICIADYEGNIYAINEVMTRITGYDLEAYKKIPLSSTYFNPNDRIEVLNILKNKGEVKNHEVLLKRGDGKIYNALLNISLIKIQQKDFILTNVQDITEIRETIKKLDESEQKFKNITEESLLGICIIQDNVLKYVNQNLADMYGYTIEEMLNWEPGELLKTVAPESLEVVMEQLRKKQAGDSDVIHQYKIKIIRKTGEHIWVNNLSKTIDYEGYPADLVTQIDINEQIIAEQDLKKSEEKFQELADQYKMLLESITDGVYALNRDWFYTLVNKNAEKLVNMPVERLLGNKITDVFPGIEKSIFFKTYERVMNTGNAERVSEAFVLPDGMEGYYSVSVYPTNEGIICIASNITEEKRIEKKLNEEREKAELYLNIAGVLLVALDRNGNITLLNKKGYELLEYEEGELSGKNWFENCLPFAERERVNDYFKNLMNGEMDIIPSYQNPIISKSGEEKLIAWSTVLFKDEKGNFSGLLSAGEDITARAKAENSLKESEMRLRNLFETMEEGVVLINLDGQIVEANSAAEKILGIKRSVIKERNYISPKWEIFNPDGSPMPLEEMAGPRAMKEKRPIKNTIMGLKRSDDTIVWLNVSASPLLDVYGGLLGVVGTFADFTEFKKAEEKIVEHSKNLEILNHIIISGNNASNLSFLLNDILDFTLKLMGMDGGAIYLVDEQKYFADIVSFKDLPRDFIEKVKKVSIYESPYRNVLIDGEPVYTETIMNKHQNLIKEYKFCAIASVPLFSRNKVIGSLNIVSKSRKIITQNEKSLLSSIGREIGTLVSKMQVEQYLIESEEKFRTLSDQSLMGIGIAQDNKFKYVNQAYADIFGFTVEEMMNWGIEDGIKTIHPEDRDFALEQLEKKQKGDPDVINHYNYRGIKKSSDIIWIDQYSKSILYEGRPADLITIIDITERKKNEEKLKKSEKELSIRNKIQDIFLKFPDDEMYSEILTYILKIFESKYGTFGYFNENQDLIQASLTGEVWEECKMKNKNLIFPKDTWHQNIWGSIINEKKALTRNNPFKVPKGHVVIKNFLGAPIIHKNKIIGVITVANKEEGYIENHLKLLELILEILAPILHERLEKDKFQHLRKVVEKQLEASEEKLQNVINNIADVLIEINEEGIITFISPQIKDIIEYDLDKVINKNISEFFHPEDISLIKDAIKSSKITLSEVNIDIKIIHKKGYFLPVSIKGSTKEINDNIKFTGVLRDISERKRMEEMMEKEVIQLKELEDLRNDLINRISHEFNTPLNLILSGSQLLSQDYKGELLDDPFEIIDIINKGAYRLKDMVDNLLTAFKIESYDLSLNIQELNLTAIIKSCISLILPQANLRNIYITTELLKELKGKCDKNLIKKAIYNILSNAIKNTPPKGNVFIKTIEHRSHIDIIVEDSGVGITKKEKMKLFQKFGKIERYGRGLDVDIEGPGMGLYIANEIVKLHKGEILVNSKGRFKGSSFTIRLYKA
ncbi:MAG: PAS domain S-box protein [Promethearchaeota archaeon]